MPQIHFSVKNKIKQLFNSVLKTTPNKPANQKTPCFLKGFYQKPDTLAQHSVCSNQSAFRTETSATARIIVVGVNILLRARDSLYQLE